jgi:GNAT superfamily N-acetyltransferase
MESLSLREITPRDESEVAELIYASLNTYYGLRGLGQPFKGGPQVTEVFWEVYSGIGTSRCIVAENTRTSRIMGSCFFHPRKTHVALGIMNVHPNYFGFGVGSEMLRYICDFTDQNGYQALRLTQSALNLDSFSLYNKAGFVPRQAYQDMTLQIPEEGLDLSGPGMENVRDATLDDVPAMITLEMDVSGVSREEDYRFCIENSVGFWHVSVYDNLDGGLDGFMVSSAHPAFNMLGPGVIRSEDKALALILRELNQHRGKTPVVLIPVDRPALVRQMYNLGARNCELHFCQVRGQCQPYAGVNIPTFILETA